MNQNAPQPNTPPQASLRDAARHAGCGLVMGAADAIPGVSGGTVALVLGIYRRLVAAISHFDMTSLRMLLTRRWRELAQRIDLFFLLALGCGIAVGLGTFILLIHELIEPESPARPYTYAVFFGAITASSWLVMKLIDAPTKGSQAICWALGIVGAAAAFAMTGPQVFPNVEQTPPLWFTFCCGMIAICAMILPGISGSYLLLILGMYRYLSGIPKALLKGEATGADLVQFVVFALGCAIGLITFSKFLRWLLHRFEPQTMALMCGFMIGALRALWPWREGDAFVAPPSTGALLGCVALALIAAVAVCGADYLTGANNKIDEAVHEPVE
ncbi:DUF368 domain-containing protein [Blastopirellula sp. JC732]|uniref:DUF368 domain-containing protein n=1 Tax=Blastopirellula sediminis TaxID=2894196 RepID=A0A9X1MRI9_9BACT|nr:DUF368 domain-containing protein [Blastopirellula sediminis]MCC9606413.1 DUF368 domain-containing protein [Blastopirellula sediminis]MCC9630289.1 DUF368 domain-containing protein [Blastopirellula sediminis]